MTKNKLFKLIFMIVALNGILIYAETEHNFKNLRAERSEYKEKYVKIGSNNTKISSERVKQIALSHAGISERDARITKIELDMEDGILVYEIEFYTGSKKYEYEINANTGAIIEFEQKNR